MSRPLKRRPGQPGGRRDQNRKERVRALSEAALALFLERGIEGATIDDITVRAKIAKGSFYRYFDDKRALVDQMLKPVFTQMEQVLQHCSRALEKAKNREAMFEAYREVGGALAGMLVEHPQVLRLYLQECRAPALGARTGVAEFAAKVSWYAVDITRKAHRHGILRPIHPSVSALTVVGAIERLLLALLSEEEVGNPLEIPEALTSLILDGLRAKS